jgi:hypothetical protein
MTAKNAESWGKLVLFNLESSKVKINFEFFFVISRRERKNATKQNIRNENSPGITPEKGMTPGVLYFLFQSSSAVNREDGAGGIF